MLVTFLSTTLCFCSQYPTNQNNGNEEHVFTRSSAVIPFNVQTLEKQPEPKGPLHNNAVAIVQSFAKSTEYFARSIDTLLQENVSVRGRVQELENNFASVKTKQEFSSHIDDRILTGTQIFAKPVKSFDARYTFTPEEEKKLNSVYANVPEVPPQYVSKVLSGKTKQSSSKSFQAVQRYIQSTGASLQDYRKLYAKIMRASIKR